MSIFFNRILLIIALCISTFAFTTGAELNVNSEAKEITIYHSGALVQRSFTQKIAQGTHTLTFENVSSKMLLSTIKINNKNFTVLNKNIIKKLSEEEFDQLNDTKYALENELNLLEMKYKEPTFIQKVEDLEKMMGFYSTKIVEIKRQLRDVNRQLDEAKKLENIVLSNEDGAILKLLVSVDKAISESVTIQYVVGGIGWSPSYDVLVEDPNQNKIALKYIARTMSQTGENWVNVNVNLSSSFPLSQPTELPAPDGPWTIGGSGRYTSNQRNINIQQQMSQIQRLKGIEYEEITIPSYIKKVTLNGKYTIKSNSTVYSLPIMNIDLPASFYYYAYPSVDPEPFLVAEVTNWNTYGFIDGVANVSVKGNDIGKSKIIFSQFTDTLILPIGKDNSVYVKREEVANQTFTKESNMSKRTRDNQAFKYELQNNNSYEVNIKLLDQIPISQSKSVKIEVNESSNGSINEELGEVEWVFSLAPSKLVKKELAFEVNSSSGPLPQIKSPKFRYSEMKYASPRI